MTREWSTEQNAFFDWGSAGSGNLVGVARAGTGKTTTIVEMVQRMPEPKILLAAFNKSIATELQGRISGDRVEARTLHGLGFRYVKQVAGGVRIDEHGKRAFELAAQSLPPGAPRAITNLVSKLHSKAREIDPWAADIAAISNIATEFDLLPSEEFELGGWTIEKVCEAALEAMKRAKLRTPVIDFADMIFLPLVHGWVKPWYDAVVVDEAQDMSVAQLALALGARKKAGRMCVVGDNRQAIYRFRGADSESLTRLRVELDATELGLKTTYRCGKLIVAEAARIVPDFIAHAGNADGEVDELAYEKAMASIGEGDFLLSRKNAPLVRACMVLLKRGVRARIKGRDIGGGIITLVRKIMGSDGGDLDQLQTRLEAWSTREVLRAQKHLGEQACEERIALVLDQTAIVIAIAEESADHPDFERRCDELFSDDKRPSVMLSSVHRAKGLEADTVYMLSDTFKDSSIEELNIRYTAITRAKRKLVYVKGVR